MDSSVFPSALQLDRLDRVALIVDSGLHQQDGQPIRRTYLARGAGLDDFPFGAPVPIDSVVEFCGQISTPCVWLSFVLFWHFGHMITETAGNVWPLLWDSFLDQFPDGLTVLVPAEHRQEIGFLERLVGRSGVSFVSTCSLPKPILLDRVFVPRPSMVDRGMISVAHPEVMRRFLACYRRCMSLEGLTCSVASLASNSSCHGWMNGLLSSEGSSSLGKVYVSRSMLPENYRHLEGEKELEKLLLDCGWSVCYPEKLSLGQQLEVLSSARVLAGCTGSAFHLLMACGVPRVVAVVLITLDYGLEINFRNQFKLQGVNAHVLPWLSYIGDKHGSSRDVRSEIPLDVLAAQIEEKAAGSQPDWAFWRGPVVTPGPRV